MRLSPGIWHLPLSVGELAIVSNWLDFALATNLAAYIVTDVGWPPFCPPVGTAIAMTRMPGDMLRESRQWPAGTHE
jgi:hypothetical protein